GSSTEWPWPRSLRHFPSPRAPSNPASTTPWPPSARTLEPAGTFYPTREPARPRRAERMTVTDFPANQEPQFPASLAAALRTAQRSGEPSPAGVQRAIWAAARERAVVLPTHRTRLRTAGRWGSAAAAAAAIAIAAFAGPRQHATPTPTFARGGPGGADS